MDTSGYVYPMGVVERITGLTRRRIRYYEKVGLVTPARTDGGHRLYSVENVETLKRIGALLESGITTVEAVRRIMAAGLDLPLRPAPARPLPNSRDRWAPSSTPPRVLGDAATRLLRPTTPAPIEPRRTTVESDSSSYFGRIRVWSGTSSGTGAATGNTSSSTATPAAPESQLLGKAMERQMPPEKSKPTIAMKDDRPSGR